MLGLVIASFGNGIIGDWLPRRRQVPLLLRTPNDGVETVCPTTVGAKMIRDVLIEAPWGTQSFDLGKLGLLPDAIVRFAMTDVW